MLKIWEKQEVHPPSKWLITHKRTGLTSQEWFPFDFEKDCPGIEAFCMITAKTVTGFEDLDVLLTYNKFHSGKWKPAIRAVAPWFQEMRAYRNGLIVIPETEYTDFNSGWWRLQYKLIAELKFHGH